MDFYGLLYVARWSSKSILWSSNMDELEPKIDSWKINEVGGRNILKSFQKFDEGGEVVAAAERKSPYWKF